MSPATQSPLELPARTVADHIVEHIGQETGTVLFIAAVTFAETKTRAAKIKLAVVYT
jgi:hypothetical protein